MSYIDAILHIADEAALAAHLAQERAGMLTEAGEVAVFAGMPALRHDGSALVYLRLHAEAMLSLLGLPGVTRLAACPYDPDGGEALYEAVFADAGARALYRSVAGGDVRFGLLG
jgi:hypothetical protein